LFVSNNVKRVYVLDPICPSALVSNICMTRTMMFVYITIKHIRDKDEEL